MQADRFTVKAQDAIATAQRLARRRAQHRGRTGAPAARTAAAGRGLRARGAAQALRRRRGDHRAGPRRGRRPAERQRRGRAAGRLRPGRGPDRSQRAEKEMSALGDEYITVGHLLLALADKSSGVADILPDRESLAAGGRRDPGPEQGRPRPTPRRWPRRWRRFGRDLTADAKAGRLDPVIGRDEEIRRVIQVLSRRTREQPGPDRRARRRQDRDRRGPRAADRRGRRARVASRPSCDRARRRRARRRLPSTRARSRNGSRPCSARCRPPRVRSSFSSTSCRTIVGAGATEGAMDAANLLIPPPFNTPLTTPPVPQADRATESATGLPFQAKRKWFSGRLLPTRDRPGKERSLPDNDPEFRADYVDNNIVLADRAVRTGHDVGKHRPRQRSPDPTDLSRSPTPHDRRVRGRAVGAGDGEEEGTDDHCADSLWRLVCQALRLTCSGWVADHAGRGRSPRVLAC